MPSPTSSALRAKADRNLDHRSEGTEGGSVLVQVLVLGVLGLVLSTMILSGLLVEFHSLRRSRKGPQVSYAAESGVHRTIQHVVNAIAHEKGAIEQFRILAAIWNRPAPFTGEVGQVRYEARVVDVSPNLAYRAFAWRYADVTLEAEARQAGLPPQMIHATYRVRLGKMRAEDKRATRVLWRKG